jgi:DNA polymerase III alpha subunit
MMQDSIIEINKRNVQQALADKQKVINELTAKLKSAKEDFDVDEIEKLALEKQYMGTYVTEHPLDPFDFQDFKDTPDGQVIKSTYVINEASLKTTKTNKKYLSIKGYDKLNAQVTINFFNEEQSLALRPNIKKNTIIKVVGKVSHTYNNINADSIKICVRKAIDTEEMEIPEHEAKTAVVTNDTLIVPEVNIIENMFDSN